MKFGRKVPTLRGSLPSAGDLNGRTVDVTGPRRGGIKFRDRCISERRGRGTPPSVRNNGERASERAMKRKTRARGKATLPARASIITERGTFMTLRGGEAEEERRRRRWRRPSLLGGETPPSLGSATKRM